MGPTVAWLLQQGGLRLRAPAASAEGLRRTVRWVHVSELTDPTPYLSGGELLLTTGLHAGDEGGAEDERLHWSAYVDRLVARDVAALGFGVGLSRGEVPEALAEAADAAGLPLLRVPEPTPFIAISEAVAGAISRTHEEELAHAVRAQRALIGAALSPGGPRAVADELSAALDCWVVLLDEDGAARYSAPLDARRHAGRIRAGLERLPRDARRSRTHAASFDVGEDRVAVLPIAAEGRVTGYLAVGRPAERARTRGSSAAPGPAGSAEQAVLAGAVGLLSLDTAHRYGRHEDRRFARLAVLRLATGPHPELAESAAETLGVVLPPAPLRVAVLGCAGEPGRSTAEDVRAAAGAGAAGTAGASEAAAGAEASAPRTALLRAAEQHLGLSQAGALVAPYDRHTVVVLLPEAEGGWQALEEVLHRVPGARGAVSGVAQYGELPEALRRARSVFYASRPCSTPGSGAAVEPGGEPAAGGGTGGGSAGGTGGGRLLLAEDVATAGLLAQLDHPGAHGWAEVLLEPLERHSSRSKLDLISTLRVFLAHNGHVDASATELGIHRHTLRYRLDRITALLGSDLQDPTVRAELWLALLLRETRS